MTPEQIQALATAITQAIVNAVSQAAAPAPVAPATSVAVPAPAPAVVVPAPAPAPAPTVPASLPYHGVGGFMVMDRVAPNTPGTVTLPTTRNTLALPMTNAAKLTEGESLMSYIGRVCSQCGVPSDEEGMAIANTAQLINGFEALLARAGIDRTNPWSLESQAKWPLAADIYYNRSAYMTDAERAQEAAAQAAFAASTERLNHAQDAVRSSERAVREARPQWKTWGQHKRDAGLPGAPLGSVDTPT